MTPPKISYKNVSIKDIQLDVVHPAEITDKDKFLLASTGGVVPIHGGKQVRRVVVDGEPVIPSGRFWTSLYARFGLNNAFFKFFDHLEVFDRISQKEKNDKVRIALEDTGGEDKKLLAATGLNKPVVVYDDLMELLEKFKADKGGVTYHDGVIVSNHQPRIGQNQFKISGDEFANRFQLHCPIDGYGTPNVFLSLLRLICSNGAVGYSNQFKTALVLGSGHDDTRFALQRALDSFTNDEGYAIMRGRFDMATKSWASIRERQDLYKLLRNIQGDNVLHESIKKWSKATAHDLEMGSSNALMKAFDRATGDPFTMYKSDPNLMSGKQQRNLPVACKVYDMINFATELATHHVSEASKRSLQAWVGGMLSSDYDLEDTASEHEDWRDLFLGSAK